ncbi:hemoglobin subunit epsilon isoform X6 [Larimichthys crocea]|uniref:hemoglobin subunit epsilon isoform X6 n=1 Tax=Larimichthys crocea TaxID=215358 RepID=UPI000F5E094B|nr:hemoglobin subunit epsilon isoform X6 [Larimichthys crocea]
MVKWTEKERSTVSAVWEKVVIDETGPEALRRMLIVYPWTERYFETFGDIFSADTILNNSKVAAHGIVVLKELDKAVKNMDNIEGTYAALSRLHCEKLTVDPENFRILSHCILVVLANMFPAKFTPEVHLAMDKFLAAMARSLSEKYHKLTANRSRKQAIPKARIF